MTSNEALFYLIAAAVPLIMLYKTLYPRDGVKITELWVYPVKSCKGIQADSMELTKYGFKGDREFMIVYESAKDKIYRFVTQREHPQLALIAPKLTMDGVTLTAPNMEDLTVSKVSTGPLHELTHFAPEMKGIDQGDAAAKWLTRYIGKPSRLMRFPESQWKRPLESTPAGVDGVTKYADGFPILIANEASFDAVNKKLPSKITMRHFRPNIVIRGSPAWEENTWERLLTADGYVLHSVLHAERCTIPSVNPETGKRLSFDPRKACRTGRDLGLKPEQAEEAFFGENLVFKGPDGTRLKVGDILATKYK